jgi:hypothetical protein
MASLTPSPRRPDAAAPGPTFASGSGRQMGRAHNPAVVFTTLPSRSRRCIVSLLCVRCARHRAPPSRLTSPDQHARRCTASACGGWRCSAPRRRRQRSALGGCRLRQDRCSLILCLMVQLSIERGVRRSIERRAGAASSRRGSYPARPREGSGRGLPSAVRRPGRPPAIARSSDRGNGGVRRSRVERASRFAAARERRRPAG